MQRCTKVREHRSVDLSSLSLINSGTNVNSQKDVPPRPSTIQNIFLSAPTLVSSLNSQSSNPQKRLCQKRATHRPPNGAASHPPTTLRKRASPPPTSSPPIPTSALQTTTPTTPPTPQPQSNVPPGRATPSATAQTPPAAHSAAVSSPTMELKRARTSWVLMMCDRFGGGKGTEIGTGM